VYLSLQPLARGAGGFIMPTKNNQLNGSSDYGQNLVLKFGDMMGAGFTVLPNILLKHQGLLGINSGELNFIAQIWFHWWSDKDAFPSMSTISKRMGVKDDKTVRRYSKSLQDKGYLVVRDRVSKIKGQLSSEYDFSPLIDRLNHLYAQEEAERLEQAAGDWVVLERQTTPLPKFGEGGLPIHGEGPSPNLGNEEDEGNKTHLEEDESLISNRFDSDANLQQTSKSKFSKKQRKISTKPHAQSTEEDPPQREHRNGFAPIADALSSRVEKLRSQSLKTGARTASTPRSGSKSHAEPDEAVSRSRGRPKKYPVPPDLELFTRDITLEFHDSSKLASNLSFVGRVLAETGLSSITLYQLMQEARTLTKTRGNIEKPSEDDPGFLNKFPYFRKTLLDLLEKGGRVTSARRASGRSI
jgi:hypothetical protein